MNERKAGVVVTWPCRLAGTVWVAGLGKVGPGGHHLIAQGAVFRAHRFAGPCVECAEDVFDVIRVEGECAGMILAGQRRQLKVIAIDGGLPRFAVTPTPAPGAER